MFKMLLLLLMAVIDLCVGGPFGRGLEKPDCSELPNGVVWAGGCGSFGVCQNGQYTQVDCANGTVVNTRALQCVQPGDAPFPCNLPPMDCTGHENHPGYRLPLMQPDPDSGRPICSIYYTCTYGKFLPFQWCPDGTVYDESNQRCSDPLTVPPPCGLGPQPDDDQLDQSGQNSLGQYDPRQNQQTQNNPNQNRYNLNRYGNNPFGQSQNTQTQNEASQYDQHQTGKSQYEQAQKSGSPYGQDLYGLGQAKQTPKRYGGSKQKKSPYTSGQGGSRGW